jgi:lysophospholipid acyltransferase (LPLAT)-like uncharacterized protein
MIGILVYPGWRTVSVQWVPGLPSLIEFLRNQTRPVICYGWHKYELLTWLSFKIFPNELTPTAIAHDGLLSRALHKASTWYGFPVYVYRQKSTVRPKEQLIEFLRNEHPVIGLFADAGGPDGQVRQGLADLAQSTESFMVPMAMRASPGFTVGTRQRYFIPLPFSSITAFHGDPFDAGGITRQQCQAALDDLESDIDTKYGKHGAI